MIMYHYAIRLWWHLHSGIAHNDGVRISLRTAPRIAGLPELAGIDYVPRTFAARLCPADGSWREMTEDEQQATRAWLDRVAFSCRALLAAASFNDRWRNS